MDNLATTLSDLRPNEEGTVVALDGGCGFVSRLVALGFTPGATVNVVRNHGHGALIVSVLDTQIAMGRGEAAQVRVRPHAADQAPYMPGDRWHHGRG